jgi:hypothetical protein
MLNIAKFNADLWCATARYIRLTGMDAVTEVLIIANETSDPESGNVLRNCALTMAQDLEARHRESLGFCRLSDKGLKVHVDIRLDSSDHNKPATVGPDKFGVTHNVWQVFPSIGAKCEMEPTGDWDMEEETDWDWWRTVELDDHREIPWYANTDPLEVAREMAKRIARMVKAGKRDVGWAWEHAKVAPDERRNRMRHLARGCEPSEVTIRLRKPLPTVYKTYKIWGGDRGQRVIEIPTYGPRQEIGTIWRDTRGLSDAQVDAVFEHLLNKSVYDALIEIGVNKVPHKRWVAYTEAMLARAGLRIDPDGIVWSDTGAVEIGREGNRPKWWSRLETVWSIMTESNESRRKTGYFRDRANAEAERKAEEVRTAESKVQRLREMMNVYLNPTD